MHRITGVMTAVGANSESRALYLKIIGEKEKAVESFEWALLSKYHSIHKNDLARAMVAQSEQAFLALQQEARRSETVRVLEYAEMKRFFVAGDSGEP